MSYGRPHGQDMTWQDRGACNNHPDPSIFFPNQGEISGPAKRVCAGCPVQDECLEFALATKEKFGVWGGTSEYERRAIRRRRAAEERAAAASHADEGLKTCSKCDGLKPFNQFGEMASSSDGMRPDCFPCRRATVNASPGRAADKGGWYATGAVSRQMVLQWA